MKTKIEVSNHTLEDIEKLCAVGWAIEINNGIAVAVREEIQTENDVA